MREGLLASLAVMVASWGVGWQPMTPSSVFSGSTLLVPLRTGLPGVLACAVLLALGTFGLVGAWLRLGRALDGRWDAHAGLPARAAWLWSAPLMLALPIFSRDVFSYLQQGRLLSLGLDPYETGVSRLPGWFMQGADSLWAESPSPYGPLFLLFAEGTWHVTGGQVELSVTAFRLLALAGLALCVWALPRLAEPGGRCGPWAVWVVVANPLFLLYMVAGAHNDALMVGLLLAGLALMLRAPRRRVAALWGIVLVALSVAIKPLTALLLPFVGMLLPAGAAPFRPGAPRLRRTRRIGPWITTATATLAVLTMLGALSGLWFGWVRAMTTSGDAAFPYAPAGLVGLALGWAVDLVSPLPARQVAGWFYTALTVATLAFTAWLSLRRRAPEPLAASAAVLAVAVLAAPIVQPWYLLWVLPLLACAPRPLSGAADHPRWLGWVTAAAVLALTAVGVVDQLSVAQWLPLWLVRTVAAAASLAAAWWIVRGDPVTAAVFPRGRGAPPDETIEPRGRPPGAEPPDAGPRPSLTGPARTPDPART
ncbi:polyprenol phosphomannose-dependent alpha 1,6 mannosyltransferase MptB, partial [Micrococcus sp.]|uniref:polyprenol phosphomannose-dependent alpha 1,6 mannosyltransferase MptB n=1 Tax=Micrococcus sp. TaxID=1271 RepID=UPI0026DBACEF